MEQLFSVLVSLAIFGAVVYATLRALGAIILTPIHKKLDRLLELEEQRVRESSIGAR